MAFLDDTTRAHAEYVTQQGARTNNWGGTGNALIIDRLDRLVVLAEALLSEQRETQ
ncbi:hypothetical protein [Streptomyces sp. LN499]|uniref:hypothetical protein n=1 Tax=Streptomyces sp. LN499 TaxID=3112977 RepID=UPI003722E499